MKKSDVFVTHSGFEISKRVMPEIKVTQTKTHHVIEMVPCPRAPKEITLEFETPDMQFKMKMIPK